MLVNKVDLDLQNLVTPFNETILSLKCVSMELIMYVTGESNFSTADNLQAIQEESIEGKEYQNDVNYAKLEGIAKDFPTLDCCLFLRIK